MPVIHHPSASFHASFENNHCYLPRRGVVFSKATITPTPTRFHCRSPCGFFVTSCIAAAVPASLVIANIQATGTQCCFLFEPANAPISLCLPCYSQANILQRSKLLLPHWLPLQARRRSRRACAREASTMVGAAMQKRGKGEKKAHRQEESQNRSGSSQAVLRAHGKARCWRPPGRPAVDRC